MGLRYAISVTAMLTAVAGVIVYAHAQNAVAPVVQSRPGVVMMAPIPDSHSETISGEHHFGPHVLSDADHAAFVPAFAATDHGDWDAARRLATQGKDNIARDIITWRYLLDETGGASFDEIDRFVREHPDWPRHDALLARAEKAMPESASADSVLTWFGSREPVSGFGDIRLGEALMKTGKRKDGTDRIRKGWSEHSYAPAEEIAILTKHGDLFSPEVHKQRLEYLLWNDDLASAERQMARVDARDERLAEARIKLSRGLGSAHATVEKLPESMRDDPGVLFDEARALRRQGDDNKAEALLIAASGSKAARDYADDWWSERHLEARQAIKDGRYRVAYNLVSENHLDSGSDYADAEFLSGWLALRFLKNEKLARGHFEALAAGVGTPISRARAQYWLGRTEEALDHKAKAWQHYHQAAQNPATFYGQLALARIDENPVLRLAGADPDTAALRARFDADDRTHAMRVLAEMGEDDWLRTFAAHLMLEAPDGPHMKLLAELMLKLGNPALSVRAAKQASYNGALMLSYSHPVIEIPRVPGLSPPPEPALVLGVTRQESEFDTDVVSRAGALGLMQIMPGGARETASAHGLRYNPPGLTSDPQYNMQIGQAQLADFLVKWGGSYILATAAYNAGDSNVRKWIAAFGDPRDAHTDPIDWIELIPFGETRNYVQRVLENTAVYRNRLAGNGQKLTILADLYRPRTPDSSPLRYEPPSSATEEIPVPKPSPRRAAAGEAPTDTAEPSVPVPAPKPAGQTTNR